MKKSTTDGTKLGAGLVAASGRKAMMRRGALTHRAGGAQGFTPDDGGSRIEAGKKAGWEGFSSLIPETAATASEQPGINAEAVMCVVDNNGADPQ